MFFKFRGAVTGLNGGAPVEGQLFKVGETLSSGLTGGAPVEGQLFKVGGTVNCGLTGGAPVEGQKVEYMYRGQDISRPGRTGYMYPS